MLILAVDTSTRTGSAALLRDGEILAEISGYEETPYSTRLFRDVHLLREKTTFRLEEIDVFAVAAGPGSFTGLRVGLTAVKAWAEVYQKPIAAVSGLEAIAAEGVLSGDWHEKYDGQTIAAFLDARRGQVFGAIYRPSSQGPHRLELASEESIFPMKEFAEIVQQRAAHPVLLVSPTPDILSESLNGRTLPCLGIRRVSAALAPMIGKLGFESAQRGALVDSLRLDANYVRRSDAEAAWKDSG